MDQPFELGSVDVEELILGHDFDIREQESRIVTRVGDAAENRLPCNSDLMDQLAMLVDVGMRRFAAEYIDRAALQIVGLSGVSKKRSCGLLAHAPSGLVPIE
jgi:hypothetical protein